MLKAAREKQWVNYEGVPIRLSADFSKETLQARRIWQEIFKVMESRGLQPRLLYPARLSFRIDVQIKSFQARKNYRSSSSQTIVIWNVKWTYLRKRRKLKLWTIKWQKIHIYQQLKLKNKLSKQEEQGQNHGYRDHFNGCQMGEVYGWMGEGIKKYK